MEQKVFKGSGLQESADSMHSLSFEPSRFKQMSNVKDYQVENLDEKRKVNNKVRSVGVNEYSDKQDTHCLLYTSPSPRDATLSRMPSSA